MTKVKMFKLGVKLGLLISACIINAIHNVLFARLSRFCFLFARLSRFDSWLWFVHFIAAFAFVCNLLARLSRFFFFARLSLLFCT